MDKKKSDDEDMRESDRILKRIENESEVIGTSSFARTASKVGDHFAGNDGAQDDQVEIWGKRVARALSLGAFIFLAFWLYNFLTRGA